MVLKSVLAALGPHHCLLLKKKTINIHRCFLIFSSFHRQTHHWIVYKGSRPSRKLITMTQVLQSVSVDDSSFVCCYTQMLRSQSCSVSSQYHCRCIIFVSTALYTTWACFFPPKNVKIEGLWTCRHMGFDAKWRICEWLVRALCGIQGLLESCECSAGLKKK